MPRPPLANESQRINILLPAKLLLAVRTMAKRQGSPTSELIRQALREYVGRAAAEAKAARAAQ